MTTLPHSRIFVGIKVVAPAMTHSEISAVVGVKHNSGNELGCQMRPGELPRPHTIWVRQELCDAWGAIFDAALDRAIASFRRHSDGLKSLAASEAIRSVQLFIAAYLPKGAQLPSIGIRPEQLNVLAHIGAAIDIEVSEE